jgi:hypothetical protein
MDSIFAKPALNTLDFGPPELTRRTLGRGTANLRPESREQSLWNQFGPAGTHKVQVSTAYGEGDLLDDDVLEEVGNS